MFWDHMLHWDNLNRNHVKIGTTCTGLLNHGRGAKGVYETPLIENVPAGYNSPCMCYPLYNILLNKILLLEKWVWVHSVHNLPEYNVPVFFFPAVNRVVLYSCLKMKK
jgi:hypothetical protein